MKIDNSVNQDEVYVSKSYANILNNYKDVLEKYKKSNQGKLISPAVEGQMMSMTQLFDAVFTILDEDDVLPRDSKESKKTQKRLYDLFAKYIKYQLRVIACYSASIEQVVDSHNKMSHIIEERDRKAAKKRADNLAKHRNLSGRPKLLTQEDKYEIYALKQGGNSIQEIMNTYGVKKSTVYKVLKEMDASEEAHRRWAKERERLLFDEDDEEI